MARAVRQEPTIFNRPYLISRLTYRIQELAYGGVRPETRARLEALGEQLDGGNVVLRRIRPTADRSLARACCASGRASSMPSRSWPTDSSGRVGLTLSLRHRPRHHRHEVERVDVLRAKEPR